MKIIVQMDPIERLNLAGDSTFALLLEAQDRGYDIDIYTPNMLTLSDGLLSAEAQQIKVHLYPDRIEKLNEPKSVMLDEYDIIMMRQDPPFDLRYITTLYILDIIKDKNQIIIGNKEDLLGKSLLLDDLNFIMPDYDFNKSEVKISCSAKIRSLSEPKKGILIKNSDTFSFEFDEPAEAITKGQACVLYDNDRVLGGGIIKQKLN